MILPDAKLQNRAAVASVRRLAAIGGIEVNNL